MSVARPLHRFVAKFSMILSALGVPTSQRYINPETALKALSLNALQFMFGFIFMVAKIFGLD